MTRIRDLSECGLKLATPEPLRVGSPLRIKMPGTTDWIAARVVWSAGGTSGIAFARAIEIPRLPGLKLEPGGPDLRFMPERPEPRFGLGSKTNRA